MRVASSDPSLGPENGEVITMQSLSIENLCYTIILNDLGTQ